MLSPQETDDQSDHHDKYTWVLVHLVHVWVSWPPSWHVDTGRKGNEHCSREDSVCLVCMFGSVEDAHHLLFDCPAYSHRHQQYSHLFHHALSSVAGFWLLTNPMCEAVIFCTKTICVGPRAVYFQLGFYTL